MGRPKLPAGAQTSPSIRGAVRRYVAEKIKRDQKPCDQIYRFKNVRLKKPKS